MLGKERGVSVMSCQGGLRCVDAVVVEDSAVMEVTSKSYTLHATPYTLHPTPCTLHQTTDNKQPQTLNLERDPVRGCGCRRGLCGDGGSVKVF